MEKFTVNKEYENIAVLENNSFITLKKCFERFERTCENKEMLPPEQFDEICIWKENKEKKEITVRFTYHYVGNKLVKTGDGTYTDKENQICKRYIEVSFPLIFGYAWEIQQPFLIMVKMYINKLNAQILNKLKTNEHIKL
tara:strand:+ start:92 stop:511 length:420 start_codon:yes stop_codon:yes gene_type:complete